MSILLYGYLYGLCSRVTYITKIYGILFYLFKLKNIFFLLVLIFLICRNIIPKQAERINYRGEEERIYKKIKFLIDLIALINQNKSQRPKHKIRSTKNYLPSADASRQILAPSRCTSWSGLKGRSELLNLPTRHPPGTPSDPASAGHAFRPSDFPTFTLSHFYLPYLITAKIPLSNFLTSHFTFLLFIFKEISSPTGMLNFKLFILIFP